VAPISQPSCYAQLPSKHLLIQIRLPLLGVAEGPFSLLFLLLQRGEEHLARRRLAAGGKALDGEELEQGLTAMQVNHCFRFKQLKRQSVWLHSLLPFCDVSHCPPSCSWRSPLVRRARIWGKRSAWKQW
jgi:hypothetical protein